MTVAADRESTSLVKVDFRKSITANIPCHSAGSLGPGVQGRHLEHSFRKCALGRLEVLVDSPTIRAEMPVVPGGPCAKTDTTLGPRSMGR